MSSADEPEKPAGALRQLRLPRGVKKPALDQYGNPTDGTPPKRPALPPPPPPRAEAASAHAEQDAAPEKPVPPDSGLGELDAGHIFAAVLGSTLGRPVALVAVCILTYGITDACMHASLIFKGWRTGGLGGFLSAILDVPGSLLASPARWTLAMFAGLTTPLGVPYLMLVFAGFIFAIRSEVNLIRLLNFFAIAGAIHAAVYLKMTHPLSLMLWLPVMAGYVWFWIWYSRQQPKLED